MDKALLTFFLHLLVTTLRLYSETPTKRLDGEERNLRK